VLTLLFGAAGPLNFGFEPEDADTLAHPGHDRQVRRESAIEIARGRSMVPRWH
jgi:hypothetical protein